MSEKNDRTIPIAPIDRLIRSVAKGSRVSETACVELGCILEEIGTELANSALDLTKHANRTTMKDVDIRLAYKNWK